MSRGVRGGHIFKDDLDYKLFMETKNVKPSVINEKILRVYAGIFWEIGRNSGTISTAKAAENTGKRLNT